MKKAQPRLEFVPIPPLSHKIVDDFREQLIALLKQDNWAIDRCMEVLCERKHDNLYRISNIEKDMRRSDR